jgi:hypothetical protein
MAKRKGQTTQWPKEKDRQHNGQKKTDNINVEIELSAHDAFLE